MRAMKIGLLVIIILALLFWLSKSVLLEKAARMKNLKGQATLSWAESEEKDVTYKIYYGTDPRNGDCPPAGYEKNIAVEKGSSKVIDDLEPGKTYYFSVSAINSAQKESCFSEEMQKQIPKKWQLFWQELGELVR